MNEQPKYGVKPEYCKEDERISEVILPEEPCVYLMSTVTDVIRSAGGIPAGFVRGVANPHTVSAFDVNEILDALDLLRVRSGYTLDYVYSYDGHWGSPLLYARRLEAQPLDTVDAYKELFESKPRFRLPWFSRNREDYLPYVSCIEYSPAPFGHFQFALFCMLGQRFYLHWHSHYGAFKFLLAEDEIERMAWEKEATEDELIHLRGLNHNPVVTVYRGGADVQVLCYKLNIGFCLLHIFVSPGKFHGTFDDVQVPSKTYTMF